MSEFIEVQTPELTGKALDWAYLYACYGDGPDWRVVDGVFGIIYQRDVRVGFDGIGQVEDFQPFLPRELHGESQCKAYVYAIIGKSVRVPKELMQ